MPVPADPGTADAPGVAIEVSGLSMAYGDLLVLDDLDLVIPRGQTVALLGPNGAGKTTTVEILEGFRRPSAGTVRVLGQDPARADEEWRARVGVVLQSWRDHPKWQVRELVDVAGAYYAAWSTDDTLRPWPTTDLLERVGLSSHATHRIEKLSGGQRRRLDVAVGLVGRPELLFLDEPSTGLDPVGRRDLHDLIGDVSDLDTTILLTTHDLTEAEKLADRVIVLAGGRYIADGTADELRQAVSEGSQVRWRDLATGELHADTTADPTSFLRDLLAARPEEIEVIEVARASLEDAYLELVTRAEAGQDLRGVTSLREALSVEEQP